MVDLITWGATSHPENLGGNKPKGAKDARTAFAIINEDGDEEVIVFAGTDNSQASPSVFKNGERTLDKGVNVEHFLFPGVARNECIGIVSAAKDAGFAIGGYLGAYSDYSTNPSGGKFANTGYLADCYEYIGKNNWRKVADTMTGWTGMGFAYNIIMDDGIAYAFPGDSVDQDLTDGTILRSSSFVKGTPSIVWQRHELSDTVPIKMPPALWGKGRFGACVFKGVWIIIGGNNFRGEMYISRNKGITWELKKVDPKIFSNSWPCAAACDDFGIFQAGGDGIDPIGNPGSYYFNDTVDFTLTQLKYQREGTHASNLIPTTDGKGILSLAGNMETFIGWYRNLTKEVEITPIILRDQYRYIRDILGGAAVSNDKHWFEITVIANGVDAALGILATTDSPNLENAVYITDGNYNTYAGINGAVDTTPERYVQIDLGVSIKVESINVRHSSGTTYASHNLEVSKDGVEWKSLSSSGTFTSVPEGITVNL